MIWTRYCLGLWGPLRNPAPAARGRAIAAALIWATPAYNADLGQLGQPRPGLNPISAVSQPTVRTAALCMYLAADPL
ncbi:MAG: hypothetical protein KBH81_02730 [Phycisphaerae bacterium]|nr:hypothetical protein [Phycisphaerae bacterium]